MSPITSTPATQATVNTRHRHLHKPAHAATPGGPRPSGSPGNSPAASAATAAKAVPGPATAAPASAAAPAASALAGGRLDVRA